MMIIAIMLSTLSPPGSEQSVLPILWGHRDRSRPRTSREPRGRKLLAVREDDLKGQAGSASSASLFVLPQDKVMCCEVRLLGCTEEVGTYCH